MKIFNSKTNAKEFYKLRLQTANGLVPSIDAMNDLRDLVLSNIEDKNNLEKLRGNNTEKELCFIDAKIKYLGNLNTEIINFIYDN